MGQMESMEADTAVVIFGGAREIDLARHPDRIGCPVLLVTTAEGVPDGERLTVRVPKART